MASFGGRMYFILFSKNIHIRPTLAARLKSSFTPSTAVKPSFTLTTNKSALKPTWSEKISETTMKLKIKSRRRRKPYYLLIVPCLCMCLGTWQLNRLSWKRELMRKLKLATYATPQPLPEEIDDKVIKDMEFKPIKVRGTFDHSKEMLISPRGRVDDVALDEGSKESMGSKLFSLQGSGSLHGAHVVTPFKLSDRNITILVNRGWVPQEFSNPATRASGQTEGEIELVGVVRTSEEKQTRILPDKCVYDGNCFLRRDIDAMAKSVKCVPVFLDADVDSTVAGGPLGGQTKVVLRNKHLEYMFTWYGIAAFSTMIWALKYMKSQPTMFTKIMQEFQAMTPEQKIQARQLKLD